MPFLEHKVKMSSKRANLLERAYIFDLDALGKIYNEYRQTMFRSAYRRAHNTQQAEVVTSKEANTGNRKQLPITPGVIKGSTMTGSISVPQIRTF